jgi:hypothetical protein
MPSGFRDLCELGVVGTVRRIVDVVAIRIGEYQGGRPDGMRRTGTRTAANSSSALWSKFARFRQKSLFIVALEVHNESF